MRRFHSSSNLRCSHSRSNWAGDTATPSSSTNLPERRFERHAPRCMSRIAIAAGVIPGIRLCLAQSARADPLHLLDGLVREPRQAAVLEALGNAPRLCPLETLDLAPLLLEVTHVLEFGLDSLPVSLAQARAKFPRHDRSQDADVDLRPAEQLAQADPASAGTRERVVEGAG